MLKPSFLQATGAAYNLVDVQDQNTLFSLASTGQIDFLFSDGAAYVCLASEFGATPIATRLSLVNGAPSAYVASTALVLAGRADNLTSLGAIAGLRVSATGYLTMAKWYAPSFEIAAAGIQLLHDAKEVIFSTDTDLTTAAVYTDLVSGATDVWLVPAGYLESIAAATPPPFPASALRALQPRGLKYRSDVVASTASYPEWLLSALPSVTKAAAKATATSLLSLSPGVASAAGYAGWANPGPYTGVQQVLTTLGILTAGRCARFPSGLYDAVTCQGATYKLPEAAATAACGAANITCVAGDTCLCAPCVQQPPQPVAVYALSSPTTPGVPCAKMQVCARVTQNEMLRFSVVNTLWEQQAAGCANATSPWLTYLFRGNTDLSQGKAVTVRNTCTGPSTVVAVKAVAVGDHLLEITWQGQPAYSSPFLVGVNYVACGPNAVSQPDGTCACTTDAYALGAACVLLDKVGLGVGLSLAVMLVAVVAYLVLAYLRSLKEARWKIAFADIQFSDPLIHLGRGTYGMVVKGSYRGTPVAIKRMLPPTMRRRKKAALAKAGASVFDFKEGASGSGALGSPLSPGGGGVATIVPTVTGIARHPGEDRLIKRTLSALRQGSLGRIDLGAYGGGLGDGMQPISPSNSSSVLTVPPPVGVLRRAESFTASRTGRLIRGGSFDSAATVAGGPGGHGGVAVVTDSTLTVSHSAGDIAGAAQPPATVATSMDDVDVRPGMESGHGRQLARRLRRPPPGVGGSSVRFIDPAGATPPAPGDNSGPTSPIAGAEPAVLPSSPGPTDADTTESVFGSADLAQGAAALVAQQHQQTQQSQAQAQAQESGSAHGSRSNSFAAGRPNAAAEAAAAAVVDVPGAPPGYNDAMRRMVRMMHRGRGALASTTLGAIGTINTMPTGAGNATTLMTGGVLGAGVEPPRPAKVRTGIAWAWHAAQKSGRRLWKTGRLFAHGGSGNTSGTSGGAAAAGAGGAAPVDGGASLNSVNSSAQGTLSVVSEAKREQLRRDFIVEMRVVVHLRHPNITTVMGACVERDTEPLLVMEFMERGSLHDLLRNETLHLDGDILIPLIKDVVAGMMYLHLAKPPVLHNDLKSANVLIDSSFRAKVADFGLSTKRAAGGMVGTPYFMAPELLVGGAPSTATDVYAFGILLYEVLSRRNPYEGEDAIAVLLAVANISLPTPKRPAIPANCPKLFKELMTTCWAPTPAMRPSFKDIADRLQKVNSKAVTQALMSRVAEGESDKQIVSQVFPPRVAKALKEGRTVQPESYEAVTIFFSDVIGFQDYSASLPASTVMDMLDRLYKAFDAITQKHGLFKVETIGDAYMVVGGLPEPQEDHTARVAAFALDAVAAAAAVPVAQDNPTLGFLAIRAGFHSGPVVGSVVGHVNPRFCLFGDTVNTASRMESNSSAGRIHMSKLSADLLRQQSPELSELLVSRGKIAVKGKGEMETYWLGKAARDATPPRGDRHTASPSIARLRIGRGGNPSSASSSTAPTPHSGSHASHVGSYTFSSRGRKSSDASSLGMSGRATLLAAGERSLGDDGLSAHSPRRWPGIAPRHTPERVTPEGSVTNGEGVGAVGGSSTSAPTSRHPTAAAGGGESVAGMTGTPPSGPLRGKHVGNTPPPFDAGASSLGLSHPHTSASHSASVSAPDSASESPSGGPLPTPGLVTPPLHGPSVPAGGLRALHAAGASGPLGIQGRGRSPSEAEVGVGGGPSRVTSRATADPSFANWSPLPEAGVAPSPGAASLLSPGEIQPVGQGGGGRSPGEVPPAGREPVTSGLRIDEIELADQGGGI